MEVALYHKDATERLQLIEQHNPCIGNELGEVRVVRCGGENKKVLDFNPRTTIEEHSIWLWGGDWTQHLEWDPNKWQWRRIEILADTNILNYSTKRGYRTTLMQNNHQMRVDAKMEATGYTNKTKAKKINRVWHPYLTRKVSAMQ